MQFWQTLLLTIMGFVLTGVVGTWITHFWQKRNWRYQQEYSFRRELLNKQIAVVEELSDLIGYRKYRMFRVVAALRSRDSDRLNEAWKSYDEAVVRWNDSVSSNITKLRQFFSKGLQYDLDIYITPEFQEIGSRLESLKRRFLSIPDGSEFRGELKYLNMRLESFGASSNVFIGDLWRHIDGLRSTIDGKPTISFENIDQLKTWYLFKNLFLPRQER